MYRAFEGGAIGVKAPYDEAVELAAHFGFEGICLNVGYLMETGPETVVQMLDERGLQSAGWGLPVSLLAPAADFKAQLAKLPEVADRCARAGDQRCFTWVLSGSNEMAYDEMFDFVCGRAAQVARILRENDVRLGLEFLGPKTIRARFKHEFIYTMDAMLDLCRAVGTGNVGLLLDSWHLYTGGGRMGDVRKLADADVVAVHINDAPAGIPLDQLVDNARCLPGETDVIDVRRFLQGLREIGYTGPVIVEPFSERVRQMKPEEAIRATKAAMDSVWPG
jgi:sugar phosphate isomerase/epimerase